MSRRHSSEMGDAATRGGRTNLEGAFSRPTRSNSSTARATVSEDAFICSRRANVTRLKTNSLVSRTFARLSFSPPSTCCALGQKNTVGGDWQARPENEKGARLAIPCSLIVLIQPIGRGTTSAVIGLCDRPARESPSAVSNSDGSTKSLSSMINARPQRSLARSAILQRAPSSWPPVCYGCGRQTAGHRP